MRFSDIIHPDNYRIAKVVTKNNRLSGMGIIEGNELKVIFSTKHLITFSIGMTVMFARRNDIDMILTKV